MIYLQIIHTSFLFTKTFLVLVTLRTVQPDEDIPEHFVVAMNHSRVDKDGKIHLTRQSHSVKRCAIQEMQEHLPPHSFVQRAGFIINNVHTMFEYFFQLQQTRSRGFT